MNNIIKNQAPLIYAFVVVSVFAVSGVLWNRFFFDSSSSSPSVESAQNSLDPSKVEALKEIAKLEKDEPIKGNKDAQYALIEFTDYECPFCQNFHTQVTKLVEDNKDFKLIVRNLPLAQLHPNAPQKAKSAICVNKVAGNDKFWEFVDYLYQDLSVLPVDVDKKVADFGVDTGKYTECLTAKSTEDIISKHFEQSQSIGANGTPTTVVVNTKNGKADILVGAVSVDQIVSTAKSL